MKVIIALCLASISLLSFSQDCTGIVTAFGTVPINEAEIKLAKGRSHTFSDSLGRFRINAFPGDILEISAKGFVTARIKIKKETVYYVNLDYRFSETSYGEAIKAGHISSQALDAALRKFPHKGARDFSRYQNIYELIRDEIRTLRVSGTNVYNTKAISFSMSSQVLYVVDNVVVFDISYISPSEIEKIEFLEGPEAVPWGVRGANGVLRISLKGK